MRALTGFVFVVIALVQVQVQAQFPREPEGVKRVRSKFHEGVEITYKNVSGRFYGLGWGGEGFGRCSFLGFLLA